MYIYSCMCVYIVGAGAAVPTAVLSQTVAFDDRGAPADPDEVDKSWSHSDHNEASPQRQPVSRSPAGGSRARAEVRAEGHTGGGGGGSDIRKMLSSLSASKRELKP